MIGRGWAPNREDDEIDKIAKEELKDLLGFCFKQIQIGTENKRDLLD